MNTKSLGVVIPPKLVDADDEFEEEEECPLSAEIEVVHDKVFPNLHGILKQRSISESSEDQSLSASSCSPESPRDEFFKKSVKFNDRVDKTTYKTRAAVSSMTQALKSKRRRNRKKEEKRNRKNSGSSEGSSDEHRMSDTDHTEKTVERIEEITNEENVDHGNEEEEYVDAVESVVSDDMNRTCENTLDSSKSTTISEETEKETKVNNDNDKQKKLVKDIKEKLNMSNEDGICDSDDEFDSGNIKMEINSKTTLKNEASSESVEDDNRTKNKNMKEADEEDENTLTVTSDLINKPSDLTNIIGEGGDTIVKIRAADKTNGEDSGVECGEGSGDKGDKSEVETALSWNEQPPVNSQEHRTDCAFEFSNAVIYDLDID